MSERGFSAAKFGVWTRHTPDFTIPGRCGNQYHIRHGPHPRDQSLAVEADLRAFVLAKLARFDLEAEPFLAVRISWTSQANSSLPSSRG
jgi:hypothetical protein